MAIPTFNPVQSAVLPQVNPMTQGGINKPIQPYHKPAVVAPVQGAGGLTGAGPQTQYNPASQGSSPYQAPQTTAGAQGSTNNYSYGARPTQPMSAGSHLRGLQNYDQFRDAAQSQFDRQFNPQMEAQTRKFENDMSARGIQAGTDAYNDAYSNLFRNQNDLRAQGVNGAMQAGLAAQGQFAGQDLQRQNMMNQYNIAGLNANTSMNNARLGAETSRYGMDLNNQFNQNQLQEQGRQFGINDLFRTNQLNESGRQFDVNDIFRNQQLDQQGLMGLGNLFLGFGNQNLQQQAMQNGFNSNWFNQANSSLGQSPSGSFVPTTGLTQGSIAAGNNAAQAAANNNSAIGSLLGAGFGAAGSAGGFGALFSDRRLKKNIRFIGIKDDINIYEFDYKDPIHGAGRYRGVMAQEVLQSHPKAVYKDGEYLKVDYAKLPVKMEVVAQ